MVTAVVLSITSFAYSQQKFNVTIDSIVYDVATNYSDLKHRDSIMAKLLIGTWVDQNSETIFKRNGMYFTTFTNSQNEKGEWSVKNGFLFYIPNGERYKYLNGKRIDQQQAYKILSFSNNEMRTKAIGDTTIWVARKVE